MDFNISIPTAGSDFIGRNRQLDRMSMLLADNNPAIALIGIPHIGKRSIARRFVSTDPWYASADTHPAFEIDMSRLTEKSGYEMMRSDMIIPAFRHLEATNPAAASGEIRQIAEAIAGIGDLYGVSSANIGNLNRLTPHFFDLLTRAGVTPTYIYNRFERASLIVATELFSIFRQLIQAGTIRQILLSSRPIDSIVAEADKINLGEVSSYPSCVDEIYVGMFDKDEYNSWCKAALDSLGIHESARKKWADRLASECGRFPYLLNSVAANIRKKGASSLPDSGLPAGISIEPLFSELLRSLDHLIFSRNEQMMENGHSRLTNTLFNICYLGWSDDRRDNPATILTNFGLLQPMVHGHETTMVAFSQAFADWFITKLCPPADDMVRLAEKRFRQIATEFLMDRAEEVYNDYTLWEKYLTDCYIEESLDYRTNRYREANESIRRERLNKMSAQYVRDKDKYPGTTILDFALLSDYRILFFNTDQYWDNYFAEMFLDDICGRLFIDRYGFIKALQQLENYRNNAVGHVTGKKMEALANERDDVTRTCMAIYTQFVYD